MSKRRTAFVRGGSLFMARLRHVNEHLRMSDFEGISEIQFPIHQDRFSLNRDIDYYRHPPRSGPNCRRAEGNVRRACKRLVISRQRGSSASTARR
jgi:hypothetical protein